MKTYLFPMVVEPDESRWSAYIPGMVDKGAATWGHTREEAIRNMQEVARMVIESLLEDGEPLPEVVKASEQPMLTVTI